MLSQPIHTQPRQEVPEVLTDFQPDSVNPFPGLRPFTVDECHLYFGREGQVDEILLKLATHHFVCVMGYSGSGKSSLMSCGLVPMLYGGFVSHSSPHWHVIITRPGTSPMENLAESVIQYLVQNKRIQQEDIPVYRAIIISVLRSGPNGLAEVSRFLQTFRQDNVFFMLDQFEELFRYQDATNSTNAENDTQAYVNLILHAIKQTDTPVFVAITMRSDFIAKCAAYPGLTQVINQSNYLVPQMTREQKKLAIEGPVAVAGGKISQRLLKKLLSDMGNNQDQLPILQHALMRTWDYWVKNHEPGEPMDIRHYNAIGRIEQALSQHANEVLEELSPREREIAEVLFKNITEKRSDSRGMRRPGKLGLIARLADADEEEMIAVVEHFRKPGRSFLMPPHTVPLTSESIIELSHESLMRIWTRLNSWVDEEFESAQMYKRLSEAAAMYQIGRTGLWRPPDLQLALNWQKKQRPTREWAQRYDEAFERAIVFLDTSRITYEAELKNQELQQRRMLRRARITAVVLGVAAVIALLFLVFAYIQKVEADNQTRLAKDRAKEAADQKAIAEQRQREAEAATKLANRRKEELERALIDVKKALAEADRQRLAAEKALKLAKEQETLAIAAGEKEKEQRLIAEIETKRANENYDKANRLYMLTVAQKLAGISFQEDDDRDLAGAQIMQAYHFNTRYGGKKYDPYIYNGLYHAMRLFSGSSFNAVKVPGPPRNRINSVAVSSRSTTFYAAGADGRIFIGNYEKLTSEPTGFENPYPNRVVALSPDERYLAVGTDSAAVQVYDLQAKSKKPVTVKGLTGSTHALEFLPDNSGFVVAKSNRTVSLINHQTGKAKALVTLPFEVKALAVSPDGSSIAGASWSGQVIIIDIQTGKAETLIELNGSQILSVKYSPDGKKLAYGTFEINDKRGLVKLFDLAARKDERQFTGHKAGVYDVEFSPDGKLLASAGADKRLQMWVLDNPEDLPVVMDNNNGFVWDIAFARGSDYLIAACHESEIRIWPTDAKFLASQICPKMSRNMTQEEWKTYVGTDIDYETTCVNLLIKDYQ
jgi:energy-coupling factor transporter ATP-binding protein EcfA2